MVRNPILAIVCSLVTTAACAQTVQNVRAAFDGERVQITYDLNYADASQKFKVAFYSSQDNFTHPLTLLTGDVGDEVAPGRDRKVVWFAKDVLPPDFDQEITFKIRVTLPDAAKLSLKPLEKTVVKRGTTMVVSWIGGAPTDQVTIELLKDGQLQERVAENIVNAHEYRWLIPKKLKTDEGYSLRIANPNKIGDETTTQAFIVKPRVSMLVKLLPVVVGAGVYLLLPDGPSPPPAGLEDLPGPIDPD